MAFIDKAKIYIKSGNGGHGALSFRREKFIEYGGPNGGNGGKGGDVIFRGNKGINTLQRYRFNQHHKAQNGMVRSVCAFSAPPVTNNLPKSSPV